MRRLLAVGAIVLAASVGTAQATTIIDFEDLTRDTGPTPVPGDKTSDGFRFDSSSDHLHVDGGANPSEWAWRSAWDAAFRAVRVSECVGYAFTCAADD